MDTYCRPSIIRSSPAETQYLTRQHALNSALELFSGRAMETSIRRAEILQYTRMDQQRVTRIAHHLHGIRGNIAQSGPERQVFGEPHKRVTFDRNTFQITALDAGSIGKIRLRVHGSRFFLSLAYAIPARAYDPIEQFPYHAVHRDVTTPGCNPDYLMFTTA